MNNVVWITGASTGIGKSLALKFSKEGWNVAISARRENLLNEIAESNKNIKPFPLDVNNSKDCFETFGKIKDTFKNIDLCVFCTGIHDPKSEKEFNLDKIRQIMETNFFGTINSINSVYEYFKNKKSGHISIVSSVAGYRGLPAAGAYCASKAALTSFSESLFFDLKRYGVRVSVVSPGFIKTPMTDKNDFPMPMIKTPEFAADEMFEGMVNKQNFEIHFPKSFTRLMKILQFVPSSLYFRLLEKGMKRKIKD